GVSLALRLERPSPPTRSRAAALSASATSPGATPAGANRSRSNVRTINSTSRRASRESSASARRRSRCSPGVLLSPRSRPCRPKVRHSEKNAADAPVGSGRGDAVGGVVLDPTDPRVVHLHPGMGVGLPDLEVPGQKVPIPGVESDSEPGRYAHRPQQDGHGAGDMLAESLAALEEEVI